MAWLLEWWTLFAALLVVFVPGFFASRALGLRRLAALAFAPVGSIAMIAVLAVLYGLVGLRWTLLSAGIGLAVIAALLVAYRLLFRIPESRTRAVGARWLVLAGLVVGAVLMTVRVTVYIGDPANFSQTNDAAFHLGAVRAILERGTASSFGLGGLIDPDVVGGFYPGAWHATTSLVTMLGGNITIAANMLTIVIASVVWPLGVAWLSQVVTGRRLAAAAAATMTPTLVIFPLLMMQYGVLYPYFLAVSLVPAAIAAVVTLTGRAWRAETPAKARIAALVLAAGLSAAALVLAQTSALLAFLLAIWLYAAWGVVEQWRRRRPHRVAATVSLVVSLMALAVLWWIMRHLVSASVWKAVRGGRDALIEMALSGFARTPPAWWLSILLVIGLYAVLRRARTRWIAVAWAAFFTLAFIAYAVRFKPLRVLSVGPWYSDPYRLSALIPVVMIPIAAAGVVFLVDIATKFIVQRRRARGVPSRPALLSAQLSAVAVAVLTAIGVGVVAAQPFVLRFQLLADEMETESPYAVGPDSWVSLDERALIARLPDTVTPGARVLGNPTTGAAMAYFLSGVDVFPAKWKPPKTVSYALLAERLQDASTDPAVCEAVHELHADYVLDLGEAEVGPGTVVPMPGFTGFDGVAGFELVDREGGAALWRITACS